MFAQACSPSSSVGDRKVIQPDDIWFDLNGSSRSAVLSVSLNAYDDSDPVKWALAGERGFWITIGDRDGEVAAIFMKRIAVIKGQAIFQSTRWHPGLGQPLGVEEPVQLLSIPPLAGR